MSETEGGEWRVKREGKRRLKERWETEAEKILGKKGKERERQRKMWGECQERWRKMSKYNETLFAGVENI